MKTELCPTQLAIEFLRREQGRLSPAEYLNALQKLRLEFADLLGLTALELREEINHAHRLGLH